MPIESIPIYGFVKTLFGCLPNFLLKRHYTSERLSKLIYVDIASRGEPVTLDLGRPSLSRLQLQVINMSPFLVELDRAVFNLQCAGPEVEMGYHTRTKLAPGETVNIFLKAAMHDGHAEAISNLGEQNIRAWLSGNLEFNCTLRNFPKNIGTLSDVNPRVINANVRRRDA